MNLIEESVFYEVNKMIYVVFYITIITCYIVNTESLLQLKFSIRYQVYKFII